MSSSLIVFLIISRVLSAKVGIAKPDIGVIVRKVVPRYGTTWRFRELRNYTLSHGLNVGRS